MNKPGDESPLPVIVNRSGGTAAGKGDALAGQIEQAFDKAGRAISLHLVDGKSVASIVRRFADAQRVVVGGGDGTIASAAQILADGAGELAILPLGTRNHFARQLEIPLDLDGAAKLAVTGRAVAVDLGAAGDRAFINNASLGAYVDLVREREGSALPKWLASCLAGWRVLRKLRPHRFDFELDGQSHSVSTAMLFIGNNVYEVSQGKPSVREALDDELLSIFALAPMTRGGVVRAALRVALRRPDMAHDFALETTAREVQLAGRAGIEVALDGERLDFTSPVTFAVRPGALRVVAPDA